MLWIGITGPMGSGKSAVSQILRQIGYNVFDADQVVHDFLNKDDRVQEEIFITFGRQLCLPDGSLDRRALGLMVFSDPQKLTMLEKILHPKVRAYITQQKSLLASNGCAVAFYDVPLLFEKNMQGDFDHVLVVSAPETIRKRRLFERSGWTDQEFAERSMRQLPPHEKESKASVVIENSGSFEELKREVLSAIAQLKIPLPTSANP